MKKIYSFTLVLLTLLSCLFFSACGDKYKKLKIDLYSHGGDKLSEVNFLIEPNKDSSREFGVKLKNIDKDDVGQVVVYSIPSELVTVSNYRYDGRTCYVNITPNMSASNAKLVISHLDSGKKKELNLNIEQKATGLNVNTLIDKYVVGIPSDPSVSNIHMVDLSKMINLLPAGSTDNIYFKFVGGQALINIEPIALDLEGFADVCSGFKVSGSAHESVLKVYPVTYMENYTYEDVEAHKKLYENKIIEIHFKKLLDNTNVLLKADDENIDVGKICLIENDKKLNSFKLNLKYKESIDSLKALTETEYLDYYKIDLLSESEVVTAELDAYKNVFVTANSFTEDFENVKIILNPKNAVGDITSIEMPVEVKAVSKPDLITVTRFGEKVDTSKPIDIFDYYGEDGGNALGALFGFTPEAKNGANIFESFTDMQIIIDPTILNSNVVGGVFENVYTNNDFSENLKLSDYDGENVNSKKLSISVYLYTKPLRFYYDEDNKVMKSEKFNANSNIRIKYIEDNSKKEHPTDFSIEVKTINSSTVTYWEEMECASVKLNFNPLEGVTAAVLETGFYTDNPEPTSDEVFPYDNLNPKYIYLDRKNTVNTRYEYNGKHVDGNFIRLKNGTVKGVNDEVISLATFRVEVVPLFNAKNPLTLYSSFEYDCNEMGSSELDYIYDINKDNINFVTLMIKEDTSIGDYEIVISQAGIVKLSVTCRVLETMKIDSLKSDNIIFETNNKAFKNNTGKYSTANYIVASGFKENKSLLVEVDLPKDIKESNSVFEDEFSVVGDYEFNFEIVDEGGGNFTGTYPDGYAKENYFVKNHNLSTSNSAYLGFLKGTYIDGANRYVKLTIDVKMKEVGDITKEPFVNADNPNNTATVSIYFFIYEEITKQSISINETYAQKYPTNYMSAYYKDESKLDLEITLKDKEGNVNEDLWKYVFMQGTNYTSWVIDKATLVNSTLSGNGRKNNLIFKHDSQTGSYTAIIKAYVKQFDNTFELQCIVDVDKPILTEKVIINSPVETDYKGRYYINLKQGESYEINAVNFSNFGEVTHQDVVAKIVDNSGSSLNIDAYFEFDGTNPLKFKVKDVSTEPFKLVVFAKDVLKQDLDSQINGFNNPKQFIMNNFQNPEDNYRHLNAYFVLDIVVSDGSETNPYLIKNAKDFWGIDDNDLAKEAYYCVMNNISANIVADDSIMKPIEGFAGHIKTLDNQIFAIDSVYLNNAMYNLFSDFSGEIQNIKFNVEYNYNFVEENLDRELGVFKTNNGKLLNVGVNVGGEASFKSTDSNTEYWFGGLVGVNYGTIVYDRPMIAVDGSFGENNPINNVNAVVYFGGLVGKNTNAIIGYEKLVGADEIVISSSNIREDTLSAIEIYSKLSGDASAVGGVVGLNTYYDDADDTKDTVGTIRNAFVQAVIHAKDSNNVGGVIGKNNQKTTAWKFNLSGATVSLDDDHYEIIANQSNPDNADFRAVINVKSASKIIANNNVGGIVGLDNYGVYVDCDYQVLNLLNKETSITANENVGGIVGKSTYGKFAFCSVMSYAWKYNQLGVDNSKVITNTADIYGNNYVGGVVGLAYSNVGLTAGDGEKVLSDKVFVISSSVNAYISTEGTNANIGGLISSNIEDPSIDYSIIYNSYFIGKMDGLVQYNGNDLCLDSGKTTIINNVYSLNIIGNTIKSGKVGLINDITPHSLVSLGIDYWWYKTDVNGGYIFVTKDKIGGDDSLPIFDLAPDNITTTVAKAYQKGGLTDTLVLDYYDFSSNSLVGEEVLLRANQDMNRNYDIYKLEETAPGSGVWENKGLINIAVLPKNIGTVVINVSSNRTSVVDVSFDGKLVVNGIGECDLTFSSPLNPNATSTIHVVVDYPVGTEFKISRSLSVEDKDQYVEKDSTEQISVNHSKHYFTVSKGVFEYDTNGDGNTDYYLNYKAKENLNLKVVVDYLGSGIDVANYKDYIQISGKAYENDNKTVKLDTKTPFIISVLKEAEESFNITATPFIEVGSSQIYYDGTNGTINLGNKFKVSTNTGIVDASFSYDEAVVYPNDTVYLKAYLTTDKEYDLIDVKGNFEVLSNDNFKYEKVALTHNKYNIRRKADDKIVGSFILDVYEISGLDKGLQTVSIRIEFSDINIENEEANLEIIYDLNLNRSNPSVVYVILPQRINKIEIKNYYLNNNKELELLNVLKPSKRGEMIIDIVPDNGYYDYLEISDVTGSEEIYFHHVGKDGYPLTNKTDVSSDGKGIKLYYYKDKGEDYSRYHIRTEISSDYSSKPHTIQVRAYTKESLLIGKPYEIIVNVRMLPEVVATYVLPDGSDGKVAGSVEGLQREIKDVYLANGVEAHIRVNTKNSNRMSYNLQSSDPSLLNKYEFVQNVDNHYILKPKASAVVDPGDIGKTIKVTIYAYSDMENGDIDEEYCSIEFKLASFVIHGVSVNQSVDTLATKEIYGYYDRELKLNFYFDKNDVSYYNPIDGNDQYWNVDYVYENGIENNFADGNPLKEIYTILKEINSVDANGISSYLILNSNKKQELNKHLYDLNGLTKNNIELKYNVLTVEKNYQPEYLAMAFGLYLDGSAWKVDNYNKNVNYIVDKNFKLAFKDAIQWYEPTVINEVEDFLNMESGDQYILNTDLELENYVPLDVKILEFDGNGHTITIKSFGSFDSADIEMGLFAKIYPNMIVKNVNLVYAGENLYGNYTLGTSYNEYTGTISYLDICNNPNVSYTSARFGGIAAINYGVVTNCVVSGEIVLRASQLESKSASGSGEYGIDFNIGGLVAENTTYTDSANEFDTEYTSGYITHSTSELKIIALANIGGFVHTNNGKIVSCGVDGKASIYGYDAEPGKTIVIEAGGFAVTNNNEISMSYASYNAVSEKKWFGTILEGTMSIKDNSAGFVYNNVGSISDAYVYMGEKGDNSNKFAGFVLTNTGSVTRAYSIINKGDIPGKESAMFAPPGTTNLKDCIEFVNLTNSYSSGFDPAELETVNVSYATYKSWYENHGFAFGDNKNAVWKISSGSTPKLVSTNEMTLKNGFKPLTITKNPDEIVDGVVQSTYKTSYAQYGTKNNPFIIDSLKTWNHIFKENNDLIVMHSYYRIVRDIDFALHGDNPITSTTVFKGNIQGNNMELNNIMLYSTKNLDSLGLFAKLEGANDVQIDNAVRNLKLTTTSVWASSTSSVGVLAGIIEDFNIYNISISHTTNGTMVGQNAVGGLAGVVRGDFDMDQISSNIGANSTRASTVPYYSIYMSKSNGEDVSKNLNNVYYAGSVVGILDGYTRTDYNVNATTRDLITSKYKYNKVRNIVVNGQITLIGDTVGGAFGFVGERVYVQRVDINLSGSLFGYQYSAGLAGENRGVIDGDIKVVLADDVLSRSKFVSAGLVGLNLGGLVRNVEVKANIIKTTSEHNVGGIIGRNIHGTIANAHFDGELFGNYTGGIVAVNYDHEILKMSSAGTGALHDECKTSRNLIPNVFIQYKENGVKIDNFKNLSLSINALNYLINNSRKYYGYLNKVDPSSIEEIIIKSKVYGLVVGLSFNTDNVVTKYNNGCYDIKLTDDAIFINSTLEESETDARYETNLDVDLITSGGTVISITMHDANVIDASKLDISVDRDYIVYLVGAYADAFNSWDKYSSVYFVINNISAPTP